MPAHLTKTKTRDRTEIIKMKKDKKLFITLVFLIVVQAAVAGNGIEATLEQKIMDGEFWRNQVLIDLMPYWYKHVIDEEHGAFYLNLSRDWKPMPPWVKNMAAGSAASLRPGSQKKPAKEHQLSSIATLDLRSTILSQEINVLCHMS